jgi:hypothetical protein
VRRAGEFAFDTTLVVTAGDTIHITPARIPGLNLRRDDDPLTVGLDAVSPAGLDSLRARANRLAPDLAASARRDAYLQVAAVLESHQQRAEALVYWERAVRLDPFPELDPARFNPELRETYRVVRRTTAAVGVQVPTDTTVTPGQDAWPVPVVVGRPATIELRLLAVSGTDSISIGTASVERLRTIPLVLTEREGDELQSGSYRLVARTTDTDPMIGATIAIEIQRVRVDTLEWEPPISDDLLRPETRPGPPALGHLLKGLTAGVAAGGVSYLMGTDALGTRTVPPRAIVVGASFTLAGLFGSWLDREPLPLQANIDYNDGLRADWRDRNRGVSEINRARRSDAPFRITVSARDR